MNDLISCVRNRENIASVQKQIIQLLRKVSKYYCYNVPKSGMCGRWLLVVLSGMGQSTGTCQARVLRFTSSSNHVPKSRKINAFVNIFFFFSNFNHTQKRLHCRADLEPSKVENNEKSFGTVVVFHFGGWWLYRRSSKQKVKDDIVWRNPPNRLVPRLWTWAHFLYCTAHVPRYFTTRANAKRWEHRIRKSPSIFLIKCFSCSIVRRYAYIVIFIFQPDSAHFLSLGFYRFPFLFLEKGKVLIRSCSSSPIAVSPLSSNENLAGSGADDLGTSPKLLSSINIYILQLSTIFWGQVLTLGLFCRARWGGARTRQRWAWSTHGSISKQGINLLIHCGAAVWSGQSFLIDSD